VSPPRTAAFLIALALASATPRVGRAAQPGHDEGMVEARRRFERGAALTEERRYDEAAREFRVSYELRPRKETLFAWAQVARLSGDCATAVELYRKFLASPELTPAQIEATELSIKRCEETAPPSRPPEPAPAPAPPPLVVAAPVPPARAPAPPPAGEARRSRGAVVLGASLLGGAALALGASATFYYLSRDDERAASAAERWDDYYDPASRARTRQRLALGLLGAGVLLGGAAVVEWLATAPPRSQPALTAWIGGGGAGVAIRGRY
jgi:hypothetical protein